MGRFSQVPTSGSTSRSSFSSTGRAPAGSCRGFPKKCFCGLDPVLRTSTSVDNPGRRFYGCVNYQDGGYHILKWWDEAMMEEFMDCSQTVDNLCEKMDHILLFYAESVSVTKLEEDVKKTQAEIAQLNELKQKDDFKNLKLACVILIAVIILIISICVCS